MCLDNNHDDDDERKGLFILDRHPLEEKIDRPSENGTERNLIESRDTRQCSLRVV